MARAGRTSVECLEGGGLADRGERDRSRPPVAALLNQAENLQGPQQGIPRCLDRVGVRGLPGRPVMPALAGRGGADPLNQSRLRLWLPVEQDGQGQLGDDRTEVLPSAKPAGDRATTPHDRR